MLMPSGAHFGSWLRERGVEGALAQRARDRDHIQLVGHFQILKFFACPASGAVTYHARIRHWRDVPRCKSALARERERCTIEALFRPCYCRRNRGRNEWLAIRRRSAGSAWAAWAFPWRSACSRRATTSRSGTGRARRPSRWRSPAARSSTSSPSSPAATWCSRSCRPARISKRSISARTAWCMAATASCRACSSIARPSRWRSPPRSARG